MIFLTIVLGAAVVFALIAFLSTNNTGKDRAKDAMGAAGAGAALATGCLVQFLLAGAGALFGLYLLSKLFG
ncbi:MAG: hypothetical protein SFV32_09335 [Opitutaceae bacterium]|nr:hypothetical protein [Opitutaceae bacterium]